MTQIITNIKYLAGVREDSSLLRGDELRNLTIIEDAFLVVDGYQIADYGKMSDIKPFKNSKNVYDSRGGTLLPAYCDSHTHLVFARSREEEFVDKIKGLSYAEIAARGGGILNSAKKLAESSEDELFDLAWKRLEEVSKLGTGAIEIKSGYGLTVDAELKMLRVIKKLRGKSKLDIKSTFLGAHTYPVQFRDNHQEYIRIIKEEMLPVIARENYADFIDVFCENGFFSPDEMEEICKAGLEHGLKPKLHMNQLNSIGGIERGIDVDAISMDHLETVTDRDVDLLSGKIATASGKKWKGVSTLLPTAAFFLRMAYQPARQLIDAGCAIALASDYNPGSSPSGNMNFVIALSCIQMKMFPEEAINAATLNGAWAMNLGNELGSIKRGKKANLILTAAIPSISYLPYSFGTNLIDRVMISGTWIS